MSARDELVARLTGVALPGRSDATPHGSRFYLIRTNEAAAKTAVEAVVAAGWRKIPSVGELAAVIGQSRNEYGAGEYTPDEEVAEAIIALLEEGK